MTKVFVDESIQEQFEFIASAFVFDAGDVTALVRSALEERGLVPGRDEYKSGQRMDGDANRQSLRASLMDIAGRDVRVAVVFTSSSDRHRLGDELLCYLALACRRNGIKTTELEAFFDEGIFESVDQGRRSDASVRGLDDARLNFEQDSRAVQGIQVADAVAHTVGQILKQDLSGRAKTLQLGEAEGYQEGTPADLGWIFLMNLRHTLFHRTVIYKSQRHSFDPPTEPQVIPDQDDLVDHALHPELFGWGVFVAPMVPESVQRVVEERFARIWLGCIH